MVNSELKGTAEPLGPNCFQAGGLFFFHNSQFSIHNSHKDSKALVADD